MSTSTNAYGADDMTAMASHEVHQPNSNVRRPPCSIIAPASIHDQFMQAALDQAEEAFSVGEVPVGCVIVHSGTIIGRGRNRTIESMNPTRHAEFEAYDDVLATYGTEATPKMMSEADLYVTIEPCIMCAGALRIARIKRVFYGAANDRFGGCGSVYSVHEAKLQTDTGRFGAPYEVLTGIHAEASVEILKRFYNQENPLAPEAKRKTRSSD
eukprot:m.141376 g.141376  ORF g.141376 m.141376 type:complete len:212 (-) comp30184_c1_seq1:66-701(-)